MPDPKKPEAPKKSKESNAEKVFGEWYKSVIDTYGPAGEVALTAWVQDPKKKVGVDFTVSESGDAMAEYNNTGKLSIMGKDTGKSELIRKFMLQRLRQKKVDDEGTSFEDAVDRSLEKK